MSKSTNGTSVPTKAPSAQILRDAVGKQVGVFLDMKTYRKMLQDLEDSYDIQQIQETKNDARHPWSELKKQLQSEGKL